LFETDRISANVTYGMNVTSINVSSSLVVSKNTTISQNVYVTGTANVTGTVNIGGGIILKAGNLKVDDNYGIDFSAGGSAAGMTSELLDDYEEGTFTPTLTRASTAPTISYITNPTGKYIKVGRLVYVTLRAVIDTVSAAGTGATQITGLPFASNDLLYGGNGSIGYNDAFVNAVYATWLDSTSVYFRSGTQSSSNDSGGWQTGGYLNLSIVYYTDA
jgi:hypothetical protein